MSGKFFFVNRDNIYQIEKLLEDRDTRSEIILNQNEQYSDVVRYNRKYDTAVFVTVKTSDLRSEPESMK